MDFKIVMLPLLFVLMMATAIAPITITINTPTANQTFFPNLGDDFIDFNFTVVDTTASNSIHIGTIILNTGDVNAFPINDVNLSTNNCSFATGVSWAAPGVDCAFRFTIPRTSGNALWNGVRVFDINVGAFAATVPIEQGNTVRSIAIDNRYITTAVEALVNLLPLVVIAAMLVLVALALVGAITVRTGLLAAISAAAVVVVVIVLAAISDVLVPASSA